MEKISAVEFFEKYYTIDGKPTPPLTNFQKALLTAWDNGKVLVYTRGRQHGIGILEKAFTEYKKSKK
jgi:hypothetical protein